MHIPPLTTPPSTMLPWHHLVSALIWWALAACQCTRGALSGSAAPAWHAHAGSSCAASLTPVLRLLRPRLLGKANRLCAHLAASKGTPLHSLGRQGGGTATFAARCCVLPGGYLNLLRSMHFLLCIILPTHNTHYYYPQHPDLFLGI